MKAETHYFGFLFVDRRCEHVEELEGKEGIVRFLKEYLFPESSGDQTVIRITDYHKKRTIFKSVGGVDCESELQNHGISLPDLYQEIRAQMTQRVQGADDTAHKPEWETYYDSIGLSGERMQMRKTAKQSAKAARTVRDVAELLEGTYFDAWFKRRDGTRSWGYFNSEDFSVQPERATGDGGWQFDESQDRVVLDPNARVEYTGSGEDIHGFILLDPPE